MDGRHRRMTKSERVPNDLDHWHQAVRRARRVGDDRVFCGIVLVAVDSHYDRNVLALRRSRDQNFFRSTLYMLSSRVGIGEPPGGLEHDVHAEVFPRECAGIFLSKNFYLVAVDDDRVFSGFDVALISAVHRVVLEEVRQSLGVGQIVDGDEVQVCYTLKLRRPDDLPADSTKSVDAYPCSHSLRLHSVKAGPRLHGPGRKSRN